MFGTECRFVQGRFIGHLVPYQTTTRDKMPRSYTTPNGTTLYFVRQLGRGQFGIANAVKSRTGDMYCMKEIPVKVSDDAAKEEALTEVKLMKETCRHDNIVTFQESWFERNRLCILMEYAPNGSLDKLIERCVSTKTFLVPKKVAHFVEELASALDYCHNTLHIIHRDIKPANILIDELGSLKLTDFGLSKSLGPTNHLASTFCGSPLYMSPEQLGTGGHYSFPADMWALGAVIYEIMALSSPWTNGGSEPRSFPALVQRIINVSPDYTLLEKRYDIRLIDTTRWMLQRNVKRRATASDIVSLLEMRSPPNLAETMLPTMAEREATSAVPRGAYVTADTDTEMGRRKKIVTDAQKLATAAASIQRSYRLSQQMKKHLTPKVEETEPTMNTLKVFDRRVTPTRVHTRIREPAIAPPKRMPSDNTMETRTNECAAVIQTALRASLNRRRGGDHPPRPRSAPKLNGSGGNEVKCSTRLNELAKPRVPKRRPMALPTIRPNIVTLHPPRPAWI